MEKQGKKNWYHNGEIVDAKQGKPKLFKSKEYKEYKQSVKRKKNWQLSLFFIMCFIAFITFATIIIYLAIIINNL